MAKIKPKPFWYPVNPIAPWTYAETTWEVKNETTQPSKKPPKDQIDGNAIITKMMFGILATPANKSKGEPMPRLKFDVFAAVRGLNEHFPAGSSDYNSMMQYLEQFSTLMAQYVYCSEMLEHAVQFSGEFSKDHDEATDAFIMARKMLYHFMKDTLQPGTSWDDTTYPVASQNESDPY